MSSIIDDLYKLNNSIKEECAILGSETRKAQVEVLLSSISIKGNSIFVYPTNCPGKGRKQDILLDEKGSPACWGGNKPCPYFVGADFALEDYTKSIDCKVM